MVKSNKERMVYGVGINDSDYTLTKWVELNKKPRKQKRVWVCPYYSTWKDMLKRCYCRSHVLSNPAYEDVYVCEEWLTFSNFKTWMETQDWKSKDLDKDLFSDGLKGYLYSPKYCTFIESSINKFFLDCGSHRGDYMIGVTLHKRDKVFEAQCQNPFTKKRGYIGRFSNEKDAHLAWKDKKTEYAIELAAQITDQVVKDKFLSKLELI